MNGNWTIYESSILKHEGTIYSLARLANGQRRLVIEGDESGFVGTKEFGHFACPINPENSAALRLRIPWLNPVPLGLRTSFGFGDRIGLATPGHIAALESVEGNIAPIWAQQSVRENTRTGRSPQEVLDDAVWGIFQKGWRGDWGADADHVKEIAHIAPFIQAGYTFFTIDPSDHVDNEAQTDSLNTLKQKSPTLPWSQLETDYNALFAEYCAEPIVLDGLVLKFNDETLLRALVKYGRAIAHSMRIAQEIQRQIGGKPFDLEMSVDETDTPTSAEEHYFIANELLKRDLPIVSLAPRFVGKFQKGVDYMGSLAKFEEDLRNQTAVLHHFDRYKLSIHTGSDKFSIYDLINKYANGRVHVKTAGTSYLEALRVISLEDPALFRKILDLGHERFADDRHSYFLDCNPENVPTSPQLTDDKLPTMLEEFDSRQLLHVTFGSALDDYGSELKADLLQNEHVYEAVLITHFGRHLQPFA